MDKTHVSKSVNTVEGFLEKESVNLVDARTIERDYRFISQSDAVVVIYPTDKLSPGVSAEMHYAHAHQIPVFMYFPGTPSPFLTEIANIYKDKQAFFEVLDKFSTQKEYDNLICCDFICRGYTSQKYHEKRVEFLEKQHSSKIRHIQYKNKDYAKEKV